jgi:alcohol dehydrogenase
VTSFKAFEVSEIEDKKYQGKVIEKQVDQLPAGEVLIEVSYSSLNYKDALSASGNKGVTRNYPHTPGIDAAGVVRASDTDEFGMGDEVIVIGYDLGMNTAGGFGQMIRVPAQWVIPKPAALSARESMIIGTAGFTAALCVEKLLLNGLQVEQGPVLVTGATGGVGIFAVALLKQLGFHVAASTGKASAHDFLKSIGAADILERSELSEESTKPMLREQWAGAVDVVGGATLFNVVKSLRYGGSVAACGLVQSPVFQASVLPFILRGVNLLGVDSVVLPLAMKIAVWEKLATIWRLNCLDEIATEIGFDGLDAALQTVLKGGATGRFVLDLKA